MIAGNAGARDQQLHPGRHLLGFRLGSDGYWSGMQRQVLLGEILRAASPDEISTALYESRAYLAENPDDQRVWSAMEDLFEVERQTLGRS